MIRTYFQLQVRILHRQMRSFGLAPVYAYPLAVVIFVVFSFLLFAKSNLAPYIYGGLAIIAVGSMAREQRLTFLKICFHQKDFRRLRLAENLLIASPFGVYLLAEGAYWHAAALLIVSPLMVFWQRRFTFSRAIPTPFRRQPFEFAIGFRKHLWLILLIYFVATMAFRVENFSLLIFTIVVLFAVATNFYAMPEPTYYVWIWHLRAKAFLGSKTQTALKQGTILTLPLLITGCIIFPENWWIILAATVYGALFLAASLLAKYTDFPRRPGLPQILLLILGLLCPPFYLWLLPYFFRKASQQLKPLLP